MIQKARYLTEILKSELKFLAPLIAIKWKTSQFNCPKFKI